MTLTETRPPDTTDDITAPPVERGVAAWVVTGDHKRLGRLFALGGVAALVAALAAAFLYQLPGFGDAPDAFTRTGSRLASAAAAFAFVVGIPALWIGLATYVTPLQIGGHRLAMPRLHQLALWLFLAGGVLVGVAFVVDDTRLNGVGSNVAAMAAKGEKAPQAVLLLIAGLLVVAIGTLLASANLLVTVLNRRGEGVRLLHMPAFAWSTLSTSFVLVLSTPVFIAGLVLLYLDQRYGGTLFASGRAGARVWQHEIWIFGRPEALVFFGAGIGIYCDIVATVLRRPLAMYPVARAASAAAPLLALFGWVGATSVLVSPYAPLATIGALLIAVPALIAVLTWAASGRGAQPRLIGAALPLVAHLLVNGLLVVLAIAAIVSKVEGPDADYFRNGQLTLFTFGQAILALAAGFLYWMPKLRGRVPSTGAAAATALLLLGGIALLALPGHIVGLGGDPGVTTLGIAGAVLAALGLLTLLPAIVGPAGSATSDPYEGHTLEWAAASPPVRHNFDELPDVRSASPLYDARVDAGQTTEAKV